MKIRWSQENTARTLSYLIAVCGGILLMYFLNSLPVLMEAFGFVWTMLTPFIYAFVIAYLLVRPVAFFERLLKRTVVRNPKRYRMRRVLSIIITYLVFFAAVTILLSVVIPQLLDSISMLLRKVPTDPTKIVIPKEVQNWIVQIFNFLNLDSSVLGKIADFIVGTLATITNLINSFFPQLINLTIGIASQFYNVFFGLILSIYLLSSKEKFVSQIRKMLTAFLPQKACSLVLELGTLTNQVFGRYLSGQLIDAVVVGSLCALGMTVMGMPYAPLVGMIVCVTNVIPLVGPFIGAIPGILILLVSSQPIHALWFLIFIVCLQQLDGNVLAPLIVGGSTGISGFWTMFAVLVGGSLWGIPGIIISVPTFTVLYTVTGRIVNKLLRYKHKPTDTESYNPTHIPIK